MADLKGKVEKVVELKANPKQFFDVWRSQAHQIPNHTPSNIQAVHLHQGQWETAGSVKIWHYTVEGKNEVFKEQVEIDEENKKVSLIGLEGDVMKFYKVFKPTFDLAPKDQGCLATCIIEYEKLNENIPAPDKYMEFMINVAKEIDDGVVQAK